MATIQPINVGSVTVDRSSVTYLQGFGEKIQLVVTTFLVQSGKFNIIVDTGFNPVDSPHLQNLDVEYPGGKAQLLETQLEPFKLKLKDVNIIVNTHLHPGHSGGNRAFQAAKFLVQREELRHAFVPDEHHDLYHREDFDVGVNYILIKGDRKIVDGVRLVSTPGHSPGHQSVLVETSRGDVLLCGDACPTKKNWDERVPTGVHHDPGEFMDSLDILQSLEAEPVFCHDSNWWQQRGWWQWR